MTTDSDPLAVLSAAQAAFNDKSTAVPAPDQLLQPWTQERLCSCH